MRKMRVAAIVVAGIAAIIAGLAFVFPGMPYNGRGVAQHMIDAWVFHPDDEEPGFGVPLYGHWHDRSIYERHLREHGNLMWNVAWIEFSG